MLAAIPVMAKTRWSFPTFDMSPMMRRSGSGNFLISVSEANELH
jgi:hypothetical protein